MYRVRDLQFEIRYFGGDEGIIFETKADILEQLLDYHNNDYSGADENHEYECIEEFFEKHNINSLEEQLNWILEYGEWEIEKVNFYQCGSCEKTFDKLKDNDCPYCHSGNWVKGYIDD